MNHGVCHAASSPFLQMLHVATVMRNAFSVFNVWHRLVAMLDAYDDERVPRFQTYLQAS